MSRNNVKKKLSTLEVQGIIQFLLERCEDNGKPKKGSMGEVANKYGCSDRTIRTIWSRTREQKEQGISPIVLSNRKKLRVQPAKKVFDPDKFKEIPFSKKKNYRPIAHIMDVGKSTVQRWLKDGKIKAHTNAIKPSLTEQNALNRVKFCLQHLIADMEEKVLQFNQMQQIIHMDEKWFYISNANERYYLTPDEIEPYRHAQNKRFIIKAMFLSVVGRPFYCLLTGQCKFDGKIGVYPFTHQVPAQRGPKNRPIGTVETKVLDVVNQKVTKDFIINQVIPDIKSKWPDFLSKDIFIQQDNAKPHIQDDDVDFRRVADSDGFNTHLLNQPPNSPGLNINDLGWFRALQTLLAETTSYNLDDLLQAFADSYNDLSHTKLNFVFLSLQACMIEILKCKGSNNYKLPHMKKESFWRAGRLPSVLQVNKELVHDAINLLVEKNKTGGLENLMHDVGQLLNDD